MKRCSKCDEHKPISEFWKDKAHKDGLTWWCKACCRRSNANWQRENKGTVNAKTARNFVRNGDRYLEQNRRSRLNRKKRIFAAYGNKCACCGEHRFEFLTIDHINGGGNKHRKEVTGHGTHFHIWLEKNGYPEGFRVLCANCNTSMGFHGYCPHGNLEPVARVIPGPPRIKAAVNDDTPLAIEHQRSLRTVRRY